MRRIALLIFLAAVFPRAARPGYVTGVVTGDNVNLRAGPSLRAEIVGQARRGDRVEVLLQDGDWCAIYPPPGSTGWVSADFVGPDGAIVSTVNVRAGPSVAHARLTRLEPGEVPEIIERDGDWLRISLPRETRLWISARYVELAREVEQVRPRPTAPPVRPDRPVTPEPDPVPPAAPPVIATPVPAPPPPTVVPVPVELPPPPSPAVVDVPPSPSPAVVDIPTPPAPPLPEGTPLPTPFAPPVEASVLTGTVVRLPRPYREAGREVTHILVRDGVRAATIARLADPDSELDRFHRRRARVWGAEIGRDAEGVPLIEVKGVQPAW